MSNQNLYPNLGDVDEQEYRKLEGEKEGANDLSPQFDEISIGSTKSEREWQKSDLAEDSGAESQRWDKKKGKIFGIVNQFERIIESEDPKSPPKKRPQYFRKVLPSISSNQSTSSTPSPTNSPLSFATYDNCAVQLYKCVNGKYSLDMKQVENVFGKVSDKLIAIYAIAGKYRSGKSFMLANFLKYLKFGDRMDWVDIQTNESFKYKSSAERVTTGIWIWPEPIIKRTGDGREVAVFLMDTQGWHDEYSSSQDNALIFAYAAALSSVMIFNAEKRIGEDDLNYFQNFSTTAKLIDPQNKDEPFQKLVFLIRDWQCPYDFPYGYYDDNTSIDGKNYKLAKINPQPDQFTDGRSIREIILSTYREISAFLMPYPGKWIEKDEFNSINSDPEFLINLTDFITGLFSNNSIVPKTVGGKLVTGRELIKSAEGWANEFVYVPKSVTQSLPSTPAPPDESYYLLAYQTSLDYFDEKIKKDLAQCQSIEDFEDLSEDKKEIIGTCFKIFNSSKKMPDANIKKHYEIKLEKELKEREVIYTDIINKSIELKEIELDKINQEQQLILLKEKKTRTDLQQTKEQSDKIKKEIKKNIAKIQEKEQNEKEEVERQLNGFQKKRRDSRKKWFGKFIGNIKDFFKIK